MRDSSRVDENAEKRVLLREGRLSRGELYTSASRKGRGAQGSRTSKGAIYICQREQTNPIGKKKNSQPCVRFEADIVLRSASLLSCETETIHSLAGRVDCRLPWFPSCLVDIVTRIALREAVTSTAMIQMEI